MSPEQAMVEKVITSRSDIYWFQKLH